MLCVMGAGNICLLDDWVLRYVSVSFKTFLIVIVGLPNGEPVSWLKSFHLLIFLFVSWTAFSCAYHIQPVLFGMGAENVCLIGDLTLSYLFISPKTLSLMIFGLPSGESIS